MEETLLGALTQVGPAGPGSFLGPGPSVRFETGSGSAVEAEGPGRYRLTGTDLMAEVAVAANTEHHAAVQSVTLSNAGRKPSAPIRVLDVRWLRWDGAVSPEDYWDEIDPTGKVQFAYLEGLYRVLDTLLERFPGLMLDGGGAQGRRKDFATLRRLGTIVAHDHPEDSHICRLVQTAGARILPPHLMHTSICMSPGDGDNTIGPLELISRLAGAFSLSGHISEWSAEHTALVRGYLDGFRSYRHLLTGGFYRLTPCPRTADDWDVVQFLDPDSGEAVALAYRVRGETDAMTVRPRRLCPDAAYEVLDPFSGQAIATRSGEQLEAHGLELDLQPDSAVARHLRPL